MTDAMPYEFDTTHEQYMSLGSHEDFIPHHLRVRAEAALRELADIHREFELIAEEYEKAEKSREEKFEDAMSHFTITRDEWIRHEDEHGNVHWINSNFFDEEKPLPFWPLGDTSEWK